MTINDTLNQIKDRVGAKAFDETHEIASGLSDAISKVRTQSMEGFMVACLCEKLLLSFQELKESNEKLKAQLKESCPNQRSVYDEVGPKQT